MKSAEEIVKTLREDKDIIESYVLIREVKMVLEVGHETYHPTLRVKIYLPSVKYRQPYIFDVSHYAKTPLQATPAVSSRVSASSEEEAIHLAIANVANFIKSAISKGYEPGDDWLIKNNDF